MQENTNTEAVVEEVAQPEEAVVEETQPEGGVNEYGYDYDYTEIVANDGFIVDCTVMETTHWVEYTEVGVKVLPDGSTEPIYIDGYHEVEETVLPTTHDEYMSRCWEPPAEEETPAQPETETSVEVPVSEPEIPVLAETGTTTTVICAILGALLVTAGVIAMYKARKNKEDI